MEIRGDFWWIIHSYPLLYVIVTNRIKKYVIITTI